MGKNLYIENYVSAIKLTRGIRSKLPVYYYLGGNVPGTSNSAVGGQGIEIAGSDNSNGGFNLVLSNSNAGSNAFVDLFLQNNLATSAATHYAVLNYNSSNYNYTGFGTIINVANQLALYGTDGPTTIGAAASTSNGYVSFFSGGTSTTNERMRITSAGAVQVNGGPLQTTVVTALGTTGTVSLDPTLGNLYTCVPTGNITLNAATVSTGQTITVVVTTSGTSSYTITPTTNFKSTGALTTGTSSGKVFTIQFISDGVNFNEIARTVAM